MILKHILVSLRPHQWTKNLVVLAGLVFADRLFRVHDLLVALAAFLAFCLLSGSVYLLNDVCDLERDRWHPVKSKRPIAAGQLPVPVALGAAAAIAAVGLGAAFLLSPGFGWIGVSYLAIVTAYSLFLKNAVILDVLLIAAGFVLRAVAGAVVIHVKISTWLLVCTSLLALFLALCKRRAELVKLAEGAVAHRRILDEYSPYLLDQMIAVVTASTLMAYTLYTLADETVEHFGTANLALTVPFVIYGIFRYLYLLHQKKEGGNPAMILLTDRPMLVNTLLWGAAVVTIVYGRSLMTIR